MTFKSKRTMTALIAGIILIIAYVVYATGKSAPLPDNLKAWALAMLIFIGIGIVALASGVSFWLALHIVVGAFAFAGIAEGITSIYLYEKGV